MTQRDLSIIVVNWNSAAFTQKCLASIYRNLANLDCEVIVVDNASFDGCDCLVKAQFPQVIFLQSEINCGFARANNLALERSTGRNILYLNPDTEVIGDALQTLVKALESLPHAGMVGARLLNSDLTLQTTCVSALPSIVNQALATNLLRNAFPKWRLWGMQPLYNGRNTPDRVQAISGACMLGKREVIDNVGAFTTDYFMYAEDMDLCAKIRKAGWDIYYIPTAELVHHGGGSSANKGNNFSNLAMRDSIARYMELHHGRMYAFMYRLSTAAIAVCRLIILVAALPLFLYPRLNHRLLRALSKWSAILLWSLCTKHPITSPLNYPRVAGEIAE